MRAHAAALAAAALAGGGVATAAAAFKPCHMPYTPFTRAIESPCYHVAADLGGGVEVRVYADAVDNAAKLVSSNVSAALQPWQNGLEIATGYMFQYFMGDNTQGANLSAYLTAPLMFRPARGTTPDAAPWVAEMALQPSVWGPKSHPPAPTRGFAQIIPLGDLRVAALHRALPTPPGEADFEACDAALRAIVAQPASGYTVDAADPRTPTFAFYFPRDDMPPVPAGPFDIECWVVVERA